MPSNTRSVARAGRSSGPTVRPAHRHRRAEDGAAAVEMALVLPLFLSLVMGILTGGIALDHKIGITSAAREAARYGATLPSAQCADTTKCSGKTWAQLVQSVAIERVSGDVPAPQICVALVSGPGSSPVAFGAGHTTKSDGSACYRDLSSDTGQRVQVTMTKYDRMQVFFSAKDLNLSAKVVSRFEQ